MYLSTERSLGANCNVGVSSIICVILELNLVNKSSTESMVDLKSMSAFSKRRPVLLYQCSFIPSSQMCFFLQMSKLGLYSQCSIKNKPVTYLKVEWTGKWMQQTSKKKLIKLTANMNTYIKYHHRETESPRIKIWRHSWKLFNIYYIQIFSYQDYVYLFQEWKLGYWMGSWDHKMPICLGVLHPPGYKYIYTHSERDSELNKQPLTHLKGML